MRRLASDVITKLLAQKQKIVTTFPPSVRDTGNTIDELISGTAVFPGGSGLWRGPDCFGELPEFFPESPIMFVGHNFDSEDGYEKSKKQGGGKQNAHNFWGVLLAYLLHANIQPQRLLLH